MADETVRRLLTKIEHKELVLPEFQREFTWKKDQTRDLIDSLLKEYPIGSLLFWQTADVPALKNMPDFTPDGRVEVLLDGQQRLTALYMLTKESIPPYYSAADIDQGNDPRGLHYNLETRELGYYKKIEMENNPRWVPVLDCFKEDEVDVDVIADRLAEAEGDARKAYAYEAFKVFHRNLEALRAILTIKPPVMHVSEDANLKHALTVFDRVNSNGTPLTEADIALAHMCSAWPETRRVFKDKLGDLSDNGFDFDLTFLIRSMNAVVNGRAEYRVLHSQEENELRAGWATLSHLLDYLVNFLRGRAHVYSSDDLNTNNVLVPILGYLAQNDLKFQSEQERCKLLYWMYAALYQTRYSGSVDQKLELDLSTLDGESPLEDLIAVLREDHGEPTVTQDNLDTRGVGHPFYNMSVILIRAKNGIDWSNGLAMGQPIGEEFSLQRHHIFPRSVLKEAGYETGENLIHRKRVNEIANRVPLTKAGNYDIFTKRPAEYLPIIQENSPGNLEKFMIPTEEELWKVENYDEFLQARREIIAEEINKFMDSLLRFGPERGEQGDEKVPLRELIAQGESDRVEFKSTLRWHIHAQRYDKDIELSALKTVAAFMNADGGVLLMGVDDDGEVLGLEQDGFESVDRMKLHFTNRVRDWIGPSFMRFVHLDVEEAEGKNVLRVRCQPAVIPAYVNYGNEEHFYVRTGPSTTSLPASEIHEYVQHRFFVQSGSSGSGD
jgi:hypothetical protein